MHASSNTRAARPRVASVARRLLTLLLLLAATAVATGAQSFSLPIPRDVGHNPNTAAVGDFNGDGKPDVAVGNNQGGSVTIALGKGDGTIVSSIEYNTDLGAGGVAVGDFNKDGKLDVAVANFAGGALTNGSISVLFGNGDGTMQSAVQYNVPGNPGMLVAADLNSDGYLDLVTSCHGTNKATVLLGNANGTFSAPVGYAVGTHPQDVVVADFNNDGKLDLATPDTDSGTISILLGNGDGTFQAATPISLPFPLNRPYSISAGDLNGDGKQDIVFPSPSSAVGVLIGNGNGTFQTAVSYPTTTGEAVNAKLADLNGDGKLDVAVVNAQSSGAIPSVGVLRGNGDGTLQAVVNVPTQNSPWGLVVTDFNLDGKPDLITTNNGINRINVLLNSPSARGADFNVTATMPASNVQVASFIDYDTTTTAASFTATIDWGDGTSVNGGAVTASSSGGFNVTGTHTYATAGSYVVSIQIADTNGNFAHVTGNAIVAKKDQTITFAALADKIFGDADFTVGATATSNLSVSFSASGACTISGSNKVHITGAGSCKVTASQAGDANYNAATPVERTFTINKANAAVTLSNLLQTYDGTPKSAAVSTDPAGLAVVVTYARAGQSVDAPTAADTYDVTATVNEANYAGTALGKLVIAKASQTINFAQPADKTFGDAPFALSASATSGLPVSLQIVSGPATLSGGTVTITGAGSVKVSATQAGDANYNEAAVERTFTVNKAQATVTLSNLSHTYDSTPKTARVATSPDGLPVTVTYAQNGQAVSAPTDAGTYSVTATVNDPNYAGSATGRLVIAKAATTTALASSPNPSESGQAVTFTATVASGAGTPAGTVQFRDGVANLGSPAALAGGTASLTISDLPPGAHAVTAVYSGGANFEASASAPLAQAVRPQITISVNDVTVAEGDAGTTRADFAVTLSAASSQAVTVNYQTSDGTAQAGTDYVAASGTLTFAPGETAKTVSVFVNGDVLFEPDETFFVNLSGPSGAALARAQGVGTIVNDDARGGTVQFNFPAYSVGEGAGSLTVTVTRAGDTSGAASVAYATVDDPAAVRCDDTVSNHGAAYARCDYATVAGTLTFAAGETSKTFTVPIVDDAHVEGDETFRVRLANPQGASLGEPNAVTVTIKDNDQPGEPNPIDSTDFFVRMQYIDFLSREPEAGQPWSGVLNNCKAGDITCDRVSVSANFFRSQEFQLKGLFVFRFYKVAFARLSHYDEIVADMSSVTGTTTAELIAKKGAYTAAFAQRQGFKTLYDPMTNQQFVDTLMGRYGLPSVTTISPSSPDDASAPRVTLTRSDLVSGLNAGALTRGQVVRAVADSDEVSKAEFNPAFVAMQYFGYLRRDPEDDGYANWLKTINANPGDVRSMVNGFVNSTEYKLRFGQP